jgi:hypothetical protein
MAAKQKNLYLYLAIACFVGIILIFVFDGYMGLHDTLSMTSGENVQVISAEQWTIRGEAWRYPTQISIVYGTKASFNYEIENLRFSSYTGDVDITLWQDQEKIDDIISTGIDIPPFGEKNIDWTLDTTNLVTGNIALEGRSFTLVISHGSIERKVIMTIYSDTSIIKMGPGY